MKSRLAKAKEVALGVIDARGGEDDTLAKSMDNTNMDLQKSRHAAMFHHMSCAKAAERARWHADAPSGDKASDYRRKINDIACKHMFMFLRHALENVRDRDCYSMRYGLTRATEFYENEASEEINTNDRKDGEKIVDPKVLYFVKGGGFKPHPHDSKFTEDYKGKKSGPKT